MAEKMAFEASGFEETAAQLQHVLNTPRGRYQDSSDVLAELWDSQASISLSIRQTAV